MVEVLLLRVVHRELKARLQGELGLRHGIESLRGGRRVGANQAAGTQQNATKVARHCAHDVAEAFLADDVENLATGGSLRLTVVTHPFHARA